MSTSGSKVIVLRSNDGEIFEVEEAVAVESQTIKNMVEDVSTDDDVIPLPNVAGKILSKVLEYCKKHAETADPDDSDSDSDERSQELKKFDSEFVKGVDWNTLFNLILAANYLNIKGLLDLTCQTAADRIEDESVEKVRDIFNIENDYTREEEKALYQKNSWAFK